jgi:hypothetical protein
MPTLSRGAEASAAPAYAAGFIIDVADGRALTAIFKKLDADVAHYQTPPAKSPEPERTAAYQGRDIAEVYRKISDANGSLPHNSGLLYQQFANKIALGKLQRAKNAG